MSVVEKGEDVNRKLLGPVIAASLFATPAALAAPSTAPLAQQQASTARARPSRGPEFKLVRGGSAEGPVAAWRRQTTAKTIAHWTSFKNDLADPAKRRRMIGGVAVGATVAALGQGTDLALRHLGAPPGTAAFASAAFTSLAAPVARRQMNRVNPTWFGPPTPRSMAHALGEAAIAGVVGLAGQQGLSKLGSALSRDLHADAAVVIARKGAGLGISAGKRVVLGRWDRHEAERAAGDGDPAHRDGSGPPRDQQRAPIRPRGR